ncbi:MAG: alkaline phosphatase PhoX, partial [Microthrixaceae bacterium]
GYAMPAFPDGAATFADPANPGGWYLVVNHEVPGDGGVSSFRFAADGTLSGSSRILSGTSLNCAGGATPWGTWLSCEEFDWGRVFECDPTGATPARARPALGAFYHEAAAVASDGRIYMTEDRSEGGFYRFTPESAEDLSSGLLEVATGNAPGAVTWVEVPDPSGVPVLTRDQVPSMMAFDGG